jgi:DNA-binding PadR family transcriptional regulator
MLYNLEAKNLVTSRTTEADNGRPRKYYRLTRKGKQQLVHHRKQWEALAQAMGKLNLVTRG